MNQALLCVCVGTRKAFEKATRNFKQPKSLFDFQYTLRLDKRVPPGELHIKDQYGHLFAKFNLK